MKLNRKDLLLIAALCAAFQALLMVRLAYPSAFCFDESYYVTAARQFLFHDANENWAHPPLGKILIGLGIGAAGDSAFGWRLMSTVFGTLTLAGMAAWGWALFGSARAALRVAILAALSQILFVQSRIAMLDGFMFAFSAWALAAFTARWQGLRRWGGLGSVALAAGLMGLATAAKWSGAVGWAACGLLLAARNWRERPGHKDPWLKLAAAHALPFFAAYGAVFLFCLGMVHPKYAPPLHSEPPAAKASHPPGAQVDPLEKLAPPPETYGIADLIPLQAKMFRAQLKLRDRDLGYQSEWWSWPLMLRPMWYFSQTEIDDEGQKIGHGVALLGNPVILWGGLALLLALAVSALGASPRGRTAKKAPSSGSQARLILVFYLAYALCWAVLPRKTTFYYYYFPAGMVLCLAPAWMMERLQGRARLAFEVVFLGAALASFVFFYPILVGLPMSPAQLQARIWLTSWI